MSRRWIGRHREAFPAAAFLASLVLAGCTPPPPQLASAPPAALGTVQPLVPSFPAAGASAPIRPGQSAGPPRPIIEGGRRPIGAPPLATAQADGLGYTFDFSGVDIRDIAQYVLGDLLGANFTIDPDIQGTASLQTRQPVRREDLLPTLQALLLPSGATLTFQDGLYRVAPLQASNLNSPVVGASGLSGSELVPLRYASAAQLAGILETLATPEARLVPVLDRNALLVTGVGPARAAMVGLIRAFDVDYLAGQAYGLFPVEPGEATAVATELQRALRLEGATAAGDAIRVIAIDRANAVLVVSPQQTSIDYVGDLLANLDRLSDQTERQLHIYYAANTRAADLQPVLQRLFVPEAIDVNAPGSITPGAAPIQLGAPPGAGAAGPAFAGAGSTGPGGQGGAGGAAGGLPAGFSNASQIVTASQAVPVVIGGGGPPGSLQIIADTRRNAIMVHATPSEFTMIESTLRRLDVLPLQVLIEATIAEVTLNDSLRYGTQFFLRQNGFGATLTDVASVPLTLSGIPAGVTNATLFPGLLNPASPGLALTRTQGSAQFAIQLLEQLTDVKVVSSPQVLVLENEQAQLQVGDLVPVITQSASSVISADAPVVNSVEYRETGVILTVTPKVNSGGLVTLEIDQEVSDVVPTTTSTIDSPTFQTRRIRSRVVVQDGQTISLAGLIRDSTTTSNSGVPILKDVPILGNLFGTRSNAQARTELLVLITPRVVDDGREARALTEELRRKLAPGALLPLQRARASSPF